MLPAIPALASGILGGLLSITGSLVGRVVVALGLSVVTYTGMSSSLAWLKSQAVDAALGLPPEYVQLLSYLKVGTFISIVFSAIMARLLLNGLQSDTVKRWVLK